MVEKPRSDRVSLGIDDARQLAESALQRIGYDATEAAIVGEHLIDAALCGYEYSGLPKLLNIPESRRFALPRVPMKVLRETAISILYDGGNNVGMLTVFRATQTAIAKARSTGIAVVGVTNTWMSGRSAHYMEMIARADLIGIHTASSARSVAPLGGIKPALGTNPIAFGLPSADGPIVFDMGTSGFMMTELALRERRGQPLPDGVAIDEHGNPTRDPASARRGALLPFGGHKGFGLSFVVQALGVLAGSGLDLDGDNGCLVIALAPDLLISAEQYKAELSALVRRIKDTPRAPGVDEIRLPSERAFAHRQRALREGIAIDLRVYDALRAL